MAGWGTVSTSITAPLINNAGCASNITSASATLNGNLTSTGGDNTTVHIYWGTGDGGTTPASWAHDENLGTKGLGAFTKEISSLVASTTYYYRCYASNPAGSTWVGSTSSFTTLATPPPPPPGASAPTVTNASGATNLTSTSATLNGSITSTGNENPTVKIYWGTTDGGTVSDNWTNNINLGIKTQGSFFTGITNLSPSTTYYYRCYASNSGGAAWAGSTLSFTTTSGGVTFVYDGDGNRVKKTEGGQTILYVNRYYEKNLSTGEVTTYYYFGGMLSALRKGTSLQYIHQDHLTGTAVMSDSTGAQVGTTMKYYPFGATRSGSVPTDIKFTGQRLDGTGLYYFNARYYDPNIGRFISADPFVLLLSDFNIVSVPLIVSTIPQGVYPTMSQLVTSDPQNLNRYTYVANNPLRYIDPNGWWAVQITFGFTIGAGWGFTGFAGIAFDGNGNIAGIYGGGVGGYAGVNASGNAVVGVSSDAGSVSDLNGLFVDTGASGGKGWASGGGGWMVGHTSEGKVVNVYYGGYMPSVGLTPVEMHCFFTNTVVHMLFDLSINSSTGNAPDENMGLPIVGGHSSSTNASPISVDISISIPVTLGVPFSCPGSPPGSSVMGFINGVPVIGFPAIANGFATIDSTGFCAQN